MKKIWKSSFEDPKNIRNRSILLLLFGIVGAGVFFAESSSFLSRVLSLPLWMASVCLNTGIAISIYFYGSQEAWFPSSIRQHPFSVWICAVAWRGYLPGIGVFLVSWIWIWIWRRSPLSVPGWSLSTMQFAALSWVPLVEEVVFRKGVGPWLRRYSRSSLWGSYLSVLLFSFLHVLPTFLHVWERKIGLPLGPLFLGCTCELLFALTGRLAPCVFLHAVCNGVVIFCI